MTSTAFTSPSNYSPKSILTINSAAMIDRVDFAYLQDTLISNDTNNIITTSNNKNDDDEPNNNHNSIAATRDQIFQLGALTGMICTTFLSVPHDTTTNNNNTDNDDDESKPSPNDNPFYTTKPQPSSPKKQILSHQLAQLFLHLFQISTTCHLDLRTCILKKIQLNGQKYPVELCKGKAGKYTDYSAHTGITTTEGQCTIHTPTKTSSSRDDDVMEDDTTVEGITVLIQNFANERLWNQHHTPRNICLAMMGEVGELAELFQWKKDEGTLGERLTEKELDKVGQELADVAIYLMRLADVCQVGLGCEARKLLVEDGGVEKE
eukprot:CAMPEP_0201721744 /NCGR_PEP_ID=MMETSP0593-20130828/6348_1 /ASSEMBLY_ACC=CAM_ASM_000672 /TAXON_ID=267983 /ORGANISM="Skeletonema japonicum, Strain CCMP2506" /LENGTH=320 /DNA_ID=CAMNT_0048212613 /DNA_START=1 /DNA_END=963 /DNA_ORIENTATION=-